MIMNEGNKHWGETFSENDTHQLCRRMKNFTVQKMFHLNDES